MRSTYLLAALLLGPAIACAQQAPAKPAPAPAATTTKLAAAKGPPPDGNFPTQEQIAELTCANEYQFIADNAGTNRYLLRLDTKSPACKNVQRSVRWKYSGDDGASFIDLAPGKAVVAVRPVAQGVEIEVAPDTRVFLIGSVTVMEGVNAEGPVLALGPSEYEALQAMSARPAKK